MVTAILRQAAPLRFNDTLADSWSGSYARSPRIEPINLTPARAFGTTALDGVRSGKRRAETGRKRSGSLASVGSGSRYRLMVTPGQASRSSSARVNERTVAGNTSPNMSLHRSAPPQALPCYAGQAPITKGKVTEMGQKTGCSHMVNNPAARCGGQLLRSHKGRAPIAAEMWRAELRRGESVSRSQPD